jgi:hypothetical protein
MFVAVCHVRLAGVVEPSCRKQLTEVRRHWQETPAMCPSLYNEQCTTLHYPTLPCPTLLIHSIPPPAPQVPARVACYGEPSVPLSPCVVAALAARGVNRLFSHQVSVYLLCCRQPSLDDSLPASKQNNDNNLPVVEVS